MNTGTKIRTIARIVASLNTAVYAVSAAVTGLGYGKLTLVWTILTIAVDFAVAFVTTYYNNDYSEEARLGTGYTRYLKSVNNAAHYGEVFEEDPEEEPEEEAEDEQQNI